MILPTTYTSGLVLLILSFLGFGLWINTFKAAGTRWRFELYSIDFAAGVILFSVTAAFTLGSLGSDLAFSDRLLVAGKASQAFVAAAGFLFSLGNMLLLAGVGLLGMAGAFPISIGVAVIISSLFSLSSANPLWLISGVVLLLLAVLCDVLSCRLREAAQRRTASAKVPAGAPGSGTTGVQAGVKVAAKTTLRAPTRPARKRTGKGVFVSVLSGVMLGFFYPVGSRGMTGDLALGPYAGMLMFSVGVLISTALFDFYFLNIAIEGEPLHARAYLQGKAYQHLCGLAGGALWALGALATLLAAGVPAPAGLMSATKFFFPTASVLLAFACGAIVWKEFKGAPGKAHISLGWTAALFVLGLGLLAIGLTA